MKHLAGFLALLLVASFSSSAVAQRRLALLIGNQDYAPLIGRLANPHNDINRVGSALKQIGFETSVVPNADRKRILAEVDLFSRKIRDAGPGAIAFFYYSGHGLSNPDDRTNYLIPVDIPELQSQAAWYDAVRLEWILITLRKTAPNAIHIVVFDACRSELQLPVRTGAKGFEEAPGKPGMVVAFSTQPNAVASDRGDGNGPYARALADELVIRGQSHDVLFRKVANRVFTATGRAQRPWMHSDLLESLYLAGETPPSQSRSDPPRISEPPAQSPEPIRPDPRPPPRALLWDHNGSDMRLEANGTERRFYYVKPRPGMIAEGVRPGTLLFTGTSSGGQYKGIAYIFDRTCGSVPYRVSGNASSDLRRVVMSGQKPNQFDTDCRVVAYRNNDQLVFDLKQ